MRTGVMIVAMVLALTGVQAQAKRLGSGKSVGQQSHNVSRTETPKTPPAATPAPVTTPQGAPGAATAAKPAPAAAPAAPPAAPPAPPARPWAGMLGGLAAGLGLAWLASSLGLGAGLGQFLMVLLVGLVLFSVVGIIMRRRTQPQTSPYVFEGADAQHPNTLPQYNPRNVGNDSSARPVDTDPLYQPTGSIIGADLVPAGSQWGIPADFDVPGFVNAAKDNFVMLQKAWDHSDFATLRSMMTDAMLQEVSAQLAEREGQAKGQLNVTEVLSLDAQLLGIEDQGGGYLASVEFSGMVREDVFAGPTPFREVWNLHKSKDGQAGWLVAGVQSLQ